MLPDGELVTLSRDDDGPDLLGAFVGSEGTLGIAVRVTVRIVRVAETVRTLLAAFHSTDAAGEAVSHTIAAGILPAAIEMMDALTLEAVEAAIQPGYPAGRGRGADRRARRARRAGGRGLGRGRADLPRVRRRSRSRAAESAEERALIWRGRKSAFASMGRISPSYYVQDGVVPRTKLPEVLRRIYALGDEYGPADRHRSSTRATATCTRSCSTTTRPRARPSAAEQCATAILDVCIDAGGSLTGEHGVGVDKACSMPKLFGADDLAVMQRLRDAFDPGRAREPRQGDPDAAPLRRGAGAVPRASAGAGRGCRASLSATVEPASIAEAAEVLTGGGRVSIDREGGDVVLSTRAARPRARARAGRPDGDRRGRDPAVGAAGRARAARPDAGARPAGRSDDRRVPRRRPVRPAAPPLRRDARPRDRRHASCSPTARSRARAARS